MSPALEGFASSSVSKESACNAGDPGSIPRSGRSPGEEIGYPLQYSWASLWLSWKRIHLPCGRSGFDPWVGKIPWRRERLPTPVLRPGEFHGLYSPWDHKESDMTERLSLSLSPALAGRFFTTVPPGKSPGCRHLNKTNDICKDYFQTRSHSRLWVGMTLKVKVLVAQSCLTL